LEVTYVGKTIVIKTSQQTTSCIRLENALPVIGPFDNTARNTCSFKVVAGLAPGTIAFESLDHPEFFLQHGNFRLQLQKGLNENAIFRVVRPLSGTQGISLQSYNFPQHHLGMVERGQLSILKDIKPRAKAVFFITELPKDSAGSGAPKLGTSPPQN